MIEFCNLCKMLSEAVHWSSTHIIIFEAISCVVKRLFLEIPFVPRNYLKQQKINNLQEMKIKLMESKSYIVPMNLNEAITVSPWLLMKNPNGVEKFMNCPSYQIEVKRKFQWNMWAFGLTSWRKLVEGQMDRECRPTWGQFLVNENDKIKKLR